MCIAEVQKDFTKGTGFSNIRSLRIQFLNFHTHSFLKRISLRTQVKTFLFFPTLGFAVTVLSFDDAKLDFIFLTIWIFCSWRHRSERLGFQRWVILFTAGGGKCGHPGETGTSVSPPSFEALRAPWGEELFFHHVLSTVISYLITGPNTREPDNLSAWASEPMSQINLFLYYVNYGIFVIVIQNNILTQSTPRTSMERKVIMIRMQRMPPSFPT